MTMMIETMVSNSAQLVTLACGVDGSSPQDISPDEEGYLSLELLQKSVGGYVELVAVPRFPNFVMVVNEEGALRGMGFNRWASLLAMRPIVGDVVVCDRCLLR